MSAGAGIGVALLTILSVICAAELITRAVVRARLRGRFGDLLGSRPTVALGHRPMLIQLAERRLARVGLDTVDHTAAPDGVVLHGDARGVSAVDGGLRLDALTATTTLPLPWIRRAAHAARGRAAGGIEVRSVSLMPRRGALSVTIGVPVAFGRGIDIRLAIAVTVVDGRLVLRATDLSMPLDPVAVPIPIAWAVDSWITALRAKVIPPALDALTVTSIRWSRDAVTVDVTARDATLPID